MPAARASGRWHTPAGMSALNWGLLRYLFFPVAEDASTPMMSARRYMAIGDDARSPINAEQGDAIVDC